MARRAAAAALSRKRYRINVSLITYTVPASRAREKERGRGYSGIPRACEASPVTLPSIPRPPSSSPTRYLSLFLSLLPQLPLFPSRHRGLKKQTCIRTKKRTAIDDVPLARRLLLPRSLKGIIRRRGARHGQRKMANHARQCPDPDPTPSRVFLLRRNRRTREGMRERERFAVCSIILARSRARITFAPSIDFSSFGCAAALVGGRAGRRIRGYIDVVTDDYSIASHIIGTGISVCLLHRLVKLCSLI